MTVLLVLIMVYSCIGVAFALPFVLFGVTQLDPAARSTGWVFRLMILPGSAALWPVLAARWRASAATAADPARGKDDEP